MPKAPPMSLEQLSPMSLEQTAQRYRRLSFAIPAGIETGFVRQGFDALRVPARCVYSLLLAWRHWLCSCRPLLAACTHSRQALTPG
jgi:hypothetical protein